MAVLAYKVEFPLDYAMAAEVEIHTQSRIGDFVRWGLTRIYRTTTYIGEDTVIQQGQIALQSQNSVTLLYVRKRQLRC